MFKKPIPTAPAFARLDAKEIVGSIQNTAEYQRNAEDYPQRRALARTALELVGMDKDEYSEDNFEPELREMTREESLRALVGTLPGYTHGLEAMRLQYEDNTSLKPHEYKSMKARAVRFNHSVKELISHDDGLLFQNVVAMVTDLHRRDNRSRWGNDRAGSNGYDQEARWFKKKFEGALNGMRHEYLAYKIIQSIADMPLAEGQTEADRPQISVNHHVSTAEDLRGADLIVTLDGVTFPIDIKASKRTADNVKAKSSHPEAIITTGVSNEEFKGTFQVSQDIINAQAAPMLEKLYNARQEFLDKQSSRAKKAGHVAEMALAA